MVQIQAAFQRQAEDTQDEERSIKVHF
jgi:hypothetical protein